ncbi:MAG: glycosyltransferase family 39 protein, partial [Prolixibacteraceae bacterium]|nr:glycosyltransferase family 39 protein [Prolixibacteraceae bacterium]
MGKIKTFLFFTVLFLGLIALGYTILFAHIERLPLQIWDEAHRGVNAQEILKNNEWIVITFDGKPDLYGTKPPLLVWIQAIFMKLFGMGELAIRLPSALSGLGICLILFFALRKYVKNNWVPAIAVLTLLSSLGFVYIHGVRFGDTDPLLTFFIVLISMNFFRFIHFHKNRYLYFSFLFLALATLTKSIAVFMFVPGLIIYGLYRK